MSYSINKYVGKKRTTWGYVLELGKDANGKRQQETRQGFKLERDAEAAAKAREAELGYEEANPAVITAKSKKPQPPRKPTFAQVLDEFFSEETIDCSQHTIESYQQEARYALRDFGNVPIDQITTERLKRLFNNLRTKGGDKGTPLKPKTLQHIRSRVKAVFTLAVRKKYLTTSPFTNEVRTPKLQKKHFQMPEREHLDEVIEKAYGHRLYAPLQVKSGTGVRLGELVALLWSDYSPEFQMLSVSKALVETKKFGVQVGPPKGKRPRLIPLPPSLIEVLEEHRKAQEQDKAKFGANYDDQGYIFCPPQGGHYSSSKLSARATAFLREHGLDLSAHGLRHAHGSLLLSSGADIQSVSDRLGHADPSITLALYSHVIPSDRRRLALLWDDHTKVAGELRTFPALGSVRKKAPKPA